MSAPYEVDQSRRVARGGGGGGRPPPPKKKNATKKKNKRGRERERKKRKIKLRVCVKLPPFNHPPFPSHTLPPRSLPRTLFYRPLKLNPGYATGPISFQMLCKLNQYYIVESCIINMIKKARFLFSMTYRTDSSGMCDVADYELRSKETYRQLWTNVYWGGGCNVFWMSEWLKWPRPHSKLPPRVWSLTTKHANHQCWRTVIHRARLQSSPTLREDY